MNKHWEKEAWRIEHEANARITFTIALHGKHAWEMLLEDSDRYHSIGHGWATDNPHEWEAAIAPVLRRLFIDGRLGFATKVPVYDPPMLPPLTLTFPCMIHRSVAPKHVVSSRVMAGKMRPSHIRFLSEAKVLTQVLPQIAERQAVQNPPSMIAASLLIWNSSWLVVT